MNDIQELLKSLVFCRKHGLLKDYYPHIKIKSQHDSEQTGWGVVFNDDSDFTFKNDLGLKLLDSILIGLLKEVVTEAGYHIELNYGDGVHLLASTGTRKAKVVEILRFDERTVWKEAADKVLSAKKVTEGK